MTPLERAARALCENPSEDPDEIIMMSDDSMVPRWRAELWRVRAVLTAIREPSSAMTHAAQSESHVGPPRDDGSVEVDYHGIWASMIDQALAEGE